MISVIIHITLAFAGRPARDFCTYEKAILLPGPPFPGLHIFFVGANTTGDIIAGEGEPGIESRITWNTDIGQYVVENVDFRFEQAQETRARFLDWGFTERAGQ